MEIESVGEMFEYLSLHLANILPSEELSLEKHGESVIIRNYEDRFLRIFVRLTEFNYYFLARRIHIQSVKAFYDLVFEDLKLVIEHKTFLEARFSAYVLNKRSLRKNLKLASIHDEIIPQNFVSFTEVIKYGIKQGYISKGILKLDNFLKMLNVFVTPNTDRTERALKELSERLNAAKYDELVLSKLKVGIDENIDRSEENAE